MISKSLILGYGNLDRKDDGIAWYVLQKIAGSFNFPITFVDDLDLLQIQEEEAEEAIRISSRSHLPASPPPAFAPQLTHEMTGMVARHERICFVDAHTGLSRRNIHSSSDFRLPGLPFPESCLALAQTLYGHAQGLPVSIRGYRFGCSTGLSGQTVTLTGIAAEEIMKWIV